MNKMTNKQLPSVVPAKPEPSVDVRSTIAREIQAAEDIKQRKVASGFLSKFFALFNEYSFRTSYNHNRKTSAVSGRSATEIVSELREFYARRPRPWRAAGYLQRQVHKTRFRYRRAA